MRDKEELNILNKIRYPIFVLLVITGFVITCGCGSTIAPGDTGKTPAALVTDAGIRIITEDLPPFNYASSDGKVTGQATEVVNGILTRLNQKATIEILPWNEGYSAAIAGPDVALYSTGRTDEREKLFKWVGPVTTFDYMLYARNGSETSISSLEGAKKAGTIGVVKDDARHQFLLQNKFENLITCDTDAECLRNLLAGKTDLWLGSSVNAPSVAQEEGVSPASFIEIYSVRTVPMYIAFSKDTPDSIITSWQAALDAMKSDGTFDTIRQKYGLSSMTTTAVSSSAGDQADLALTAMIDKIENKLEPVLRTYQVLAVTPDVKSKDWQKIKPLLATLETNEPDARTWYANPNGSYYTVVDGLTTGSLKSRSYFPTVLAGKESAGTVVVSLSTGKNTAIIAVPVQDGNGVTGVLGASVYLDTLTDAIHRQVPDPFIFYAVDREGKFALHSEKGQISRDIVTIDAGSSFGKAIRQIQAKDSGAVEYDDGGVHYKATFRTSPLTGWKCVVAWPVTEH